MPFPRSPAETRLNLAMFLSSTIRRLAPLAFVPLVLGSVGTSCSDSDSTTGSIPDPPEFTPDTPNSYSSNAYGENRCPPPAASMGDPQSIDELVVHVNDMPHPLTLACFLESLSRPLFMNATKSFFSAQPAVGTRSPRIFIFLNALILSVVPEGEARVLLEMSETIEPGRSIKAEIAFPVTEELTTDSPFERLPLSNVTACGVCHDNEEPVRGIEGAVVSESLRPRQSEVIAVEDVRLEFESCDPELERDRCEMFTALFAHGDVLEQSFPDFLPTIFD